MIKSKIKVSIYFAFIIYSSIVIGIPVFATINSQKEIASSRKILALLIWIYLIYSFIKSFIERMIKINIDDNSISIKYVFKQDTINFNDIEKIQLTGRVRKKDMFNNSCDGTTIVTNDGRIFKFQDSTYSNIGEIKTTLKTRCRDKIENSTFDNERKTQTSILSDNSEIFTGNILLSFGGIIFLALLVFTLYKILNNTLIVDIGPVSIAIIFLFLILLSLHLYYFELNNENLIVRNQLLFWFKKKYSLNEIEEVVIDSGIGSARTPTHLKITTTDFKSHLFIAAEIKKKKWISFAKSMEEKNIKVRNEEFKK